MVCASCGEGPKKCSCHGRDFPSAVVEINNPEQLVLLRKVVVPATLPESDNPPAIGKYRNVILKYEDTGNVYIYSSDGIPTVIEANVPQEIWERITELEDGLEAEELHRMSADDVLQSNINTVSGGLTTLTGRVTTAEGDIDAIEGKIPSQATAQNQLADKDFVNSSIATNTANFIGTFNSVSELEAYTGDVTNNDYAFVIVTDAQGNTAYDRYKYNGDTEDWLFEYELNNSSFTAAQWAAINSGITSGNVTKLSGLADIKTIGSNLSLDANGQLSGNYTHFTGATSSTDGTQGLVPAPIAGDEGKFLKADGTWDTAGSAVNVVQTTGTSTTDVMSQNAVTGALFADPGNNTKVRIGSSTSYTPNDYSISIGNRSAASNYAIAIGAINGSGNVTTTASSYSISIGSKARATQQYGIAIGYNSYIPGGNHGIALGGNTSIGGDYSIGIGESATTSNSADYAVAIGNKSNASGKYSTAVGSGYTSGVQASAEASSAFGYMASASGAGSIALGVLASASTQGEANIGISGNAAQIAAYGYNGSEYRLLTGLYDPQAAHDAATKGYVDTATANAPTITMSATDPGEGSTLAENHFVGVYGGDPIIMDYSTNEINTGAKWIDGTSIYKKTISFGALPNATSKSVAHNISNLGRVVKTEAMTKQGATGDFLPIPFSSTLSGANGNMDLKVNTTSVTIATLLDRTDFIETYITIYYTKSS